ncbi:hypothetical protein EPN27_02190, partial [Patescibacteria group bacterium]
MIKTIQSIFIAVVKITLPGRSLGFAQVATLPPDTTRSYISKYLSLFFIVATLFCVYGKEANAMTSTGLSGGVWTLNLNKTSFAPGESTTMSGLYSGLYPYYYRIFILPSPSPWGVIENYGGVPSSGTFVAPTTPGVYNLTVVCALIPGDYDMLDGCIFPISITVATPIPATPASISGSCPSPGTSASVSWSPVSWATYYALRVNNTADGWTGTCSSANGDFCSNETSTSRSFTGTPGHSYSSWVHACNSGGCSGAISAPVFSCVAPPPTLTSSVSPSSIAYNSSATISWSSANTNSCYGYSVGSAGATWNTGGWNA